MTRLIRSVLCFSMMGFILTGCSTSGPARPEAVRQVSTLDALINGAYESNVRIHRFTGPSMIGLGTPNRIAGEMIILGRQAYRVDETGIVHRLETGTKTPFAVAAPFDAESEVPLSDGRNYGEVKEQANQLIESRNYMHAIRVRGSFASMTVRSVPRQQPPYRPLTEVIREEQVEFTYESVEGVLVGFRFPSYMKRLNAPGYHLHFLSSDRKKGGHVLDFTVKEARLQLDPERAFDMLLPEHHQFREADLTHRDEAVESVEKQ